MGWTMARRRRTCFQMHRDGTVAIFPELHKFYFYWQAVEKDDGHWTASRRSLVAIVSSTKAAVVSGPVYV